MWRELDDRSLFRELRIFDMQFIIDSAFQDFATQTRPAPVFNSQGKWLRFFTKLLTTIIVGFALLRTYCDFKLLDKTPSNSGNGRWCNMEGQALVLLLIVRHTLVTRG
ncbi:hypothetical protein ARMGADRAFT_1030014 [Armillaria gallica]|uniref:Uncharacterized protein n=1 Tax=Armillaria gallica TaxID=47427 RepID=A0A2H3DW73_ARMGA|nr:hypothetical protein ARMGADRAFT_1030014 [Armillaria gallica]